MEIIKQCLQERIQDVNQRVIEHQNNFDMMGDVQTISKNVLKIQMEQLELEKHSANASVYIQEVHKKLENFKLIMKEVEAGP